MLWHFLPVFVFVMFCRNISSQWSLSNLSCLGSIVPKHKTALRWHHWLLLLLQRLVPLFSISWCFSQLFSVTTFHHLKQGAGGRSKIYYKKMLSMPKKLISPFSPETEFLWYPWISWSSLCKPDWPRTQRSSCPGLLRAQSCYNKRLLPGVWNLAWWLGSFWWAAFSWG